MTRSATTRHFDEIADVYYREIYDAPANRHAYNLVLRRRACLDLLGDVAGPILDLGCGPGAMTVPLLERGKEVVATDLSHAMCRETSRHAAVLGTPVAAAVADAAALPFANGTFAAVVTTGVLEYVPDLAATLAEIHRVLAPHGVAILTMSLPRRLERLVVRTYARARGREQLAQYIYDRPGFDREIACSGMKIDMRTCCAFAPFPLDALIPSSVPWIDRRFGEALNRSETACDHAKTYIVRATRA